MITFDGTTKQIIVSGTTSVSMLDVYSQAKRWESEQASMIYTSPIDAVGKESLKPDIYTDIIYVLSNGWKLIPSGYDAGSTISVEGTVITDDNSNPTTPALIGSPVTWMFLGATAGTITTISSGTSLSTVEHNKLMSLGSLTEEDITKISQTKTAVDTVSEKVDRTENLLLAR